MTPSNTRKPPVKAADTRKPMAKAAARPSTTARPSSAPLVAQLELDLPAPAEHPTRSARLCIHCTHCVRYGEEQYSPLCSSPQAPVSVVYGTPPAAADMRAAVALCGPQAVWFAQA